MENNYKKTYATCTGKDIVSIVSRPGLFHPGGEVIGTEYRAFFRSDSGKMFDDYFSPAFWRELKEGTRVYFKGGTVEIIN